MSHCHDEGAPLHPPFPIPVVTKFEPALVQDKADGPCPHAKHEQARQQLFPFYRIAAQEVRNWRREAYEAGQRRAATHNPLTWLEAAGDQLIAKMEQHLASKRLAVMAGQLENEVVNKHLGWQADAPVPVCGHAQEKHSKGRVTVAFATAASIMFAQMGPELVSITASQRLEAALAFGAICGTGNGKDPSKREALCHAAKIADRRRIAVVSNKALV